MYREFQSMRYWFVLLLIPFYSFAEINSSLQSELINMGVEDQSIRNEIGKAGWDKAPKELMEKLQKIDESNTVRLKSIIKEHSWLTKDLVGIEGVGAAFLVIQHSADVAFKEKMLPYLKKSYLNNEGVTGQQVALLTDRVLIGQGKKQIYGTQFDVVDSEIIFKPIENMKAVDSLRMEMKMPSLDFYLKLIEKMHGFKDHPEIELD